MGLARAAGPLDLLWGAAGAVANTVGHLLRGHWEPGAPVRDPAESLDDVAAVARAVLPGARLRRRLYWRYSLVWRRPDHC